MERIAGDQGHRRGWFRWPFWLGVTVGLALGVASVELLYVNWHTVVPPIDANSLVVRQDAKGDGRFGAPRNGGRHHRGIDLAAPLGSPVRALRSGTVNEVGMHRGLGRFVVLDHRGQLSSLYAHLAATNVEVGQRVKQGQMIGTVGKTGNARSRWISPHLHLEITRGGEPIDPTALGLQTVVLSPAEHQTDGRGGD